MITRTTPVSWPRPRSFAASLLLGCVALGSPLAAAAVAMPAVRRSFPAPPVDGPAWPGFARDPQHAAQSAIATQDLNRIAWSTPVDLAPQRGAGGALLIHYGSPVVTSHNTVVVPVKTGAGGGFRVEARSGANGGADLVVGQRLRAAAAQLGAELQPRARRRGNRLYAPGAGGKLLVNATTPMRPAARVRRDRLLRRGRVRRRRRPRSTPASSSTRRSRSMPQGNVFFGFIVTGAQPGGPRQRHRAHRRRRRRQLGRGRGRGRRRRDRQGGDEQRAGAVDRRRARSTSRSTRAPVAGIGAGGYLLALDSATLATQGKVAAARPGTGTRARISDDGTASPTVGPDGDVYFGVLETHVRRAQRPRLAAPLRRHAGDAARSPGAFGWDDTASIVPAAMVPSYAGALALPADDQVQQLRRRRQRRRLEPGRDPRPEREPDRPDLGRCRS